MKSICSKKWHTIKPGLAPLALAWPQSWPGPNFGLKVGPNQIFGLASNLAS